jgi:phosphoenolpyruvate carboxylase
VEPVLTAHPTEAKRESVRESAPEIYALMNRHENKAYTPREQERMQRQLEIHLENLWRTGEIHVTRPTIEAELQNACTTCARSFPEALSRAHMHLREAWTAAGFDPAGVDALPPLIRFGTWIGGDRDGHPFVTAEVTARALRELRQNALRIHRRALEKIAHHSPLSSLFQKPPPVLETLISASPALSWRGGPMSTYILDRNREEPWRAAAYLMRAKLVLAEIEQPDSPAAYGPGAAARGYERLCRRAGEVGAHALGRRIHRALPRQLEAFGFHSAMLDVRQNSAFHEKALEQLLKAAGLLGGRRSRMDAGGEAGAAGEGASLAAPLPGRRPVRRTGGGYGAGLPPRAGRHIAQHGTAGLGALIVSMTRNVEDLLTVYVLAREAGLMTCGGWRPALPAAGDAAV